jgi:hypothetical protein
MSRLYPAMVSRGRSSYWPGHVWSWLDHMDAHNKCAVGLQNAVPWWGWFFLPSESVALQIFHLASSPKQNLDLQRKCPNQYFCLLCLPEPWNIPPLRRMSHGTGNLGSNLSLGQRSSSGHKASPLQPDLTHCQISHGLHWFQQHGAPLLLHLSYSIGNPVKNPKM